MGSERARLLSFLVAILKPENFGISSIFLSCIHTGPEWDKKLTGLAKNTEARVRFLRSSHAKWILG
jgi:hypothetical protein